MILLSGNTAFWRVSFNDDGTIIECRKGDAPGTQVRGDRRGEMWHSHDGRRGGLLRECGSPAWQLFGLEYCALVDMGDGGLSSAGIRARLRHNLEALASRRRWLGAGLVDYALFAKPLGKASQFVLANS